MDQQQIRQIYGRYVRRGADYPSFIREEMPGIVRMVPHGGDEHNFIAYASLDERNADQAILVNHSPGCGADRPAPPFAAAAYIALYWPPAPRRPCAVGCST